MQYSFESNVFFPACEKLRVSLFDERARKSHFHVQGFAPETRFGTEVKAARKWCISYLLQSQTRNITALNWLLDILVLIIFG